MQAHLVFCQGHVFIRHFSISDLAALDDIGDLCKRNFKGPQVVLVRLRAAGHKALGDHPSTFPNDCGLQTTECTT
jgi:hypothetical protein